MKMIFKDITMNFECEHCDYSTDSEQGLGTHKGKEHPEDLPYNDPEELDRLYNEKGLTQKEMADEMGCSVGRISLKMKEYGIDSIFYTPTPAHSNTTHGYRYWIDYTKDGGLQKQVRVHQLLACLNNDPHEVFDPNNHVHHGNTEHPYLPETEHPLANWEGNLQVMSASEHHSHHANQEKEQPQVQSAMDW